jgi:hypothetical protein
MVPKRCVRVFRHYFHRTSSSVLGLHIQSGSGTGSSLGLGKRHVFSRDSRALPHLSPRAPRLDKPWNSRRLRLESGHSLTSSAIKMSLFGGDGIAPVSDSLYETETDSSQPSSARSPPHVAEHVSPPNVQRAIGLGHATDSANDESPSDDALDSNNPAAALPTRPNRFRGGQAIWRSHTAADRQIAESLEQIQNSDLAAHLYNAHALKRRVRRPEEELTGLKDWQSGEHWLKRADELSYTDVSGGTQTHLVPSKDWTSWPLPPAKIPRTSKQTGRSTARSGKHADWAIGATEAHNVGEEMRDELLATFLRLAKERWNTREAVDEPAHKDNRTPLSRSRSRSTSVKSMRSQHSASGDDVNMKDDGDLKSADLESEDEDQNKFGLLVGRSQGTVAQTDTLPLPTFLADDERALRILEPMIASTMGKLGDLALTVRRTRLNHIGHGAYSDKSSHSEFTSGAESTERATTPSSRAQTESRPNSKHSTRPAPRAASARPHDNELKTRLNDHASHPKGDSDSNSGTNDAHKSDLFRKRSRSGSTTDGQSPSGSHDETWRMGLMGWSEVLGLAAIKGWDERVIARTAQRCATLFGETMSFAVFDESLATKPGTEPMQYTPSIIPAPDFESTIYSSTKRPLFRTGTLRCPHVGCHGSKKDFETSDRAVQHCIQTHGYDPRTNDSDNEDRTVGGVHIDGFLQPIAAQCGWIKRGKSRKKQKTAEEDTDTKGPIVVD